jgi:hypothetical protein
MNIDLLKIIDKYKKWYGDGEYLEILDNDMSFAINNGKAWYEERSCYLENNDNVREMLMLKVMRSDLMDHIINMWMKLSYQKKKNVYMYLKNNM